MAIIKILTEPDPALREKSLPVQKINAGVLRVLDNMIETMKAADGVGLAAPQIGVLKRMAVVDVDGLSVELINPEILEMAGEQVGSEGCLSVPGYVGEVTRAKKIKVKALNRNGDEIVIEAENHRARCIQHEIDHLDGVLYIDRATRIVEDG
ncbi:MAG: peptide deformylase [Syntrophomonadaceae bacterium]|nr:peptide deformylase [Syntrophomonadaceae bacterium]